MLSWKLTIQLLIGYSAGGGEFAGMKGKVLLAQPNTYQQQSLPHIDRCYMLSIICIYSFMQRVKQMFLYTQCIIHNLNLHCNT